MERVAEYVGYICMVVVGVVIATMLIISLTLSSIIILSDIVVVCEKVDEGWRFPVCTEVYQDAN